MLERMMPGREEEVGLWRILPGFLREGLLGKALPKFRHCQKGGGGGHIHDKICWWICPSNYKIEHFPQSYHFHLCTLSSMTMVLSCMCNLF